MPYRRTGRPTGRPLYPDLLTPAEHRVLERVRLGYTNAEIGEELGISGDAAKYHVANMLSKLGLPDRRALAAWQPVDDATHRWRGESAMLWIGRHGLWAAASALAAVVIGLGALAFVLSRSIGDSDHQLGVPTLPSEVVQPTTTNSPLPSPTTTAPLTLVATPPPNGPPSTAALQLFQDRSIDVCVVDRNSGVPLKSVFDALQSIALTPIGRDRGLSAIGARMTTDCGTDTAAWAPRSPIDSPAAPGCSGSSVFDIVLFLVPQTEADAAGEHLGTRTGSTWCFSGDVGTEQRQSTLVGSAEAADPVLMLRHFYFFFFGLPNTAEYIDGRCNAPGCGPLVPWAAVRNAWRYSWPDQTLNVCLLNLAWTNAGVGAVRESIEGLADTDVGRAVDFASLTIDVMPCDVTPVFDPADGPPVRTKDRFVPTRKTRDLFVFVYPDEALAEFGAKPFQRKVGQEWIQDGPDIRAATTGVYITASELNDPDRLRALLGVALGMFPAR